MGSLPTVRLPVLGRKPRAFLLNQLSVGRVMWPIQGHFDLYIFPATSMTLVPFLEIFRNSFHIPDSAVIRNFKR